MAPTERLIIPVSGPLAAEIRRVASNLNVKPYVIVRELLAVGLAEKYGITVK